MRATRRALLTSIAVPEVTTPSDAPRFTGTFSVVLDASDAGFRRLPTLYFGSAPLFAHRDVDEVVAMASSVVRSTVEAAERATFLLTLCRVGDGVGLYGRDVFNRSIFRMKLERLGVEFADDPFVILENDGRYTSPGWGAVKPDFVILNGMGATPDEVVTLEGGLLAFSLATYRVGRFDKDVLTALARSVAGIRSVAAGEPSAVVHALSG